jgi:hypothetical protein
LVVQLADALAVGKHMADRDIVAAESVQADMHMDIEAGSSTNVDIFYLFLAMPFLIRSFTSISCMVLEGAKTNKWRVDRRKCSMDAGSSSRNRHMVAHTSIAGMPTTILEATET